MGPADRSARWKIPKSQMHITRFCMDSTNCESCIQVNNARNLNWLKKGFTTAFIHERFQPTVVDCDFTMRSLHRRFTTPSGVCRCEATSSDVGRWSSMNKRVHLHDNFSSLSIRFSVKGIPGKNSYRCLFAKLKCLLQWRSEISRRFCSLISIPRQECSNR